MKKEIEPCIAFKLNYCDGGKNSNRVGFCGICSDKIIKYNIKVKKRKWCSNPDCSCRKYFDKKISRNELENCFDEETCGNFPCLESQALRDWFFNAGNDSNGNPRAIRGAKNGHLCIFTTVEPNMSETSRMIVAMFIIGKVFEGDDEESGYVESNDNFDYCLEFTPNEARQMKFWNVLNLIRIERRYLLSSEYSNLR